MDFPRRGRSTAQREPPLAINDRVTFANTGTVLDHLASGLATTACQEKRQRRGNQIDVGSVDSLSPGPKCGNAEWNTVSGGDSAKDPYPDR
jgi:hypothetical protein